MGEKKMDYSLVEASKMFGGGLEYSPAVLRKDNYKCI